MNNPSPAEAVPSPGRDLARGLGVLAVGLAPSLLAIAATPGFSTQDGPAHVYSARILNASLASHSPFDATFRVAWEPLPNWVGHLATMLAVAVWSPEVANRVVTATMLMVFALAIFGLRWVVVGRRGIEVAAILAALLALNVTWLLGFTSFLFGATLTPITLATWWAGREHFGPARTLGVATLLAIGYFCHPISLGVTVGSLSVLALLVPGPGRWRRTIGTAVAALPLVPLGLTYSALTRSGGALEPVWDHVRPSVAGLVSQVGWVDPLSLAAKTASPFGLRLPGVPAAVLAPALWIAAAVVLLVARTWWRRDRDRDRARLAWFVAAAGLLGAGLFAPDTLGVKHGHFLPQRIVLLGLVLLVPWLDLDLDLGRGGVVGRASAAILGTALAIQSAVVWDYAQSCRERVSPFLEVASRPVTPGTRWGTLLNNIRGPFRANPSLHADVLIAAATDSVFWTNYETAQYYFPVKVRANVPHPVATRFEQVAILDAPRDAPRRLQLWGDLIRDHAPQLDRIVEWGADAGLDEVTRRSYQVTYERGPIRVWSRHRDDSILGSTRAGAAMNGATFGLVAGERIP